MATTTGRYAEGAGIKTEKIIKHESIQKKETETGVFQEYPAVYG
jgi:hypothetical protein